MAHRIAVASKVPDARAQSFLKTLRTNFPRTQLRSAAATALYTIDAKLGAAELRKVARRLTHPVTEANSLFSVLAPKKYAYAIEIGFHPGVTDNVGRTAKQTIEDCLDRKLKDSEGVYTSLVLFLDGSPREKEIAAMALELHNPLIERARIFRKGEDIPVFVPRVELHEHVAADEVDLDIEESELTRIGKEGIADHDGTRRGPLALSLTSMKTIQRYFKKIGRRPTDIELESLAQTWSEHCKHTIFADPIDEIEEGIYKRYIKGATQKIRKQKGKKDFCVSVFKDNSGGIAFDDTYLVTHKVETHNSPSALDPFGGSITGIVGVNRDCLGFGLGAKPIANVYGFCVADPRDTTRYFRDKAKTEPLLPSRRILEGVIKGINHGGNQSGIPTPLGFLAIDPSYRGKPLVFAGTVGLIPRKQGSRTLYEKKARAGDLVVVAGGRVGLDGVHGATFSSEALAQGSPATAVQIGDPITQKKLSDALIREARDQGLYTSITDNGAGGISCSVAEMAKECGGCEVDIDTVPLKYPGLAPWQIWISESQERMTLAVPKKNWENLKQLFDRHDVEATVIGRFTASGRCIVRWKGDKVMDIDMDFLHDGRPIGRLKTKKAVRTFAEPTLGERKGPVQKTLLSLLARPNVGSTAFIAEQYDHEVQGTSVTKPLVGRGRVNAESALLQPRPDSLRGVVLSHGFAPWYSEIHGYAMAAAAIDTAVRGAICAGASREYLAILDNFCWSTSNTPERLYTLKRAAKAVYDIATAYGTPYISGKDSMYNDFRGFTAKGEPIHIAALPTLLISAIGVVDDVGVATTLDFKMAGDLVYLLGETHDELGGSEYFAHLGKVGNRVPIVAARANARTYDALSRAIRGGLVASATPVGRGGVALALGKAAIAGQLGADLSLTKLHGDAKRADSVLFSESQGRVVVSVSPTAAQKFEKVMKGVPLSYLGFTGGDRLTLEVPKEGNADISVATLTSAYRKPFKNW